MAEYLPVIIIAVLVLIFVVVTVLNKRTPLPKGVNKMDDATCSACNNHACGHHK